MKARSRIVKKLYDLQKLRPAVNDLKWVNTRSLFFLSTGRTGTTTLTRLLEKSDKVMALHEPAPQLFDERKAYYLGSPQNDMHVSSLFRRTRSHIIAKAKASGKLYAETSAFLSFFTPVIHDLMPNSRFVFVHRHPGEFVRSGMRRAWYHSHPNDPSRLVPRKDSPEADMWNTWGRFEKICWLWKAFNSECIKCYEMLDPDRRLILSSKDLWQNPLGSAGKIFELAGLAPPGPNEVKDAHSVIHNSQKHGIFDRFEDWDGAKRAALENIAGTVMEQLGYDAG